MLRNLALGLGAALLLGAAGTTASKAHEVSVVYEVYDEFCPDTYCGQRSYPSPLIVDGFRGDGGYKSAAYYSRNSWYRQRLARPRMVEARVPHEHLYVKRPRYTK